MAENRAELEQYRRKLEAGGREDPDTLERLCEVYSRLGEHGPAVAAYTKFLGHDQPIVENGFDAIYLEGLRATGTYPIPLRRRKRVMALVELLRRTEHVSGDIVECGCYLGLSSYVMCRHLKSWKPRFDGSGYHIFDSFEGLSEPTFDDDVPDDWDKAIELRVMSQRGSFAAPLTTVRNNLRGFPAITFHPGWIPLTFKSLPKSSYRFVHVDVDLYDPTLDAFNYFYPRLSSGGLIVSDDYSWPGARKAINEFCADHELQFQVTASNQAVIQKPLAN